MLTLPIKRKWFLMILLRDKMEEYRENKPYYIKRFQTIGLLDENGQPTDEKKEICFRNGYAGDSPSFTAECSLRIGSGNTSWGAEEGKEYLVLVIHEITSQNLFDIKLSIVANE